MGKPSELLQGTLDLLILKTVSLEPKHGWAIAKRIQQVSFGQSPQEDWPTVGRFMDALYLCDWGDA